MLVSCFFDISCNCILIKFLMSAHYKCLSRYRAAVVMSATVCLETSSDTGGNKDRRRNIKLYIDIF